MPNRVSTSFVVFSSFAFVCALVVGFLEFFGALYWLGIPIIVFAAFLTGATFSRASAPIKMSVLGACILCVPVTSVVVHQLRRAEPETILLPADFRGPFVVYYEEPCGSEPKYEDGRRSYEIPSSGVLISQFRKNPGYLDVRFYLVDGNGGHTAIPIFDWQKFETEEKYWHDSHVEFGPLTKGTLGIFWAYGSKTYYLSRNSFSYILADYSYYDSPGREREVEQDALAKSAEQLLARCREPSNAR